MSPVRIELDFVHRRARTGVFGHALFVAGIVVALFATLRVADVLAARAAVRSDLAGLDVVAQAGVRRPASHASEPRYLSRLQASRRVEHALQSPWSDLLEVIEVRPSADVALLSVEPSAVKRTVRITAESRTVDAMVEHLTMLQADARLSDVTLVSHQRQAQAPGAPWRYQIQASW